LYAQAGLQMRPFEQTGPSSAMYDNRSIWSIGGHVFVEAVFSYHQPEIFEVFAQSILKLRKYDVQGFVIRGGNGLGA
jgi:hypothetical protein